jgi:hypothetical protein
MLGGLGGGGDTFNIVMNGVNTPEEFVRQLRTYVRRNGPIKGIT